MPTERSRADVIVVGAGLAGLVATAELAAAGRRVILVDQEPEQSLGGQAFWSFGGLFLVDSPEQRRMRIRDSRELAWQDWLGTAGFDRPCRASTSPGARGRGWSSRSSSSCARRSATASSSCAVNPDRMWHYTEGIDNWDPIWPRHGIRILPGPSSLWLDATGRRLPPPFFPGFDTLGTLQHIMGTGHEHTWFVLTQKIIEKEFALSGSEQNPDVTSKSIAVAMVLAAAGAGRGSAASSAAEFEVVTLRHAPTGFSIGAPEAFTLRFGKGVYVMKKGSTSISFTRLASTATPAQLGAALLQALPRLAVTASTSRAGRPEALETLRQMGLSARGGATALLPAGSGWDIQSSQGAIQGSSTQGAFVFGLSLSIPVSSPPGTPPPIIVGPRLSPGVSGVRIRSVLRDAALPSFTSSGMTVRLHVCRQALDGRRHRGNELKGVPGEWRVHLVTAAG